MEKDDELKGIGNSYDFGARMLDPRVGRWFAPDLLESGYPSYSTYNYTLNNPIYFIDPNGKGPFDWYKNKFGNYVYDKNVKSQGDVGDNGAYKGEVVILDHKTTSTGQWINTYQLNADGTVVDSFGKQYMDNFGEFSIGNSGVKVINEHTFEEQWDEYVTNRLYKASAWLRSKEGNSWIKGGGFKMFGEIGINAYSVAYDFGTYSSRDNSVGFYMKFASVEKDFDLSGGTNNGRGSATSSMISLLPKIDGGIYMYTNTKTPLDMSLNSSDVSTSSLQLGLFRVGTKDDGDNFIGFGVNTNFIYKFLPKSFDPNNSANYNSATVKPIESLTKKEDEIILD